MTTVRSLVTELVGLFVEDRAFALAIAGALAGVVALDAFSIASGNVRAYLLAIALPIILLLSVARAGKC
jgi:hypothetical protein